MLKAHGSSTRQNKIACTAASSTASVSVPSLTTSLLRITDGRPGSPVRLGAGRQHTTIMLVVLRRLRGEAQFTWQRAHGWTMSTLPCECAPIDHNRTKLHVLPQALRRLSVCQALRPACYAKLMAGRAHPSTSGHANSTLQSCLSWSTGTITTCLFYNIAQCMHA